MLLCINRLIIARGGGIVDRTYRRLDDGFMDHSPWIISYTVTSGEMVRQVLPQWK